MKLGSRWLPMNRQVTKPKPSKLTAVWQRLTRQTRQKPPPAQNPIDTTLAWGDVLMLTTTQIVRMLPAGSASAPQVAQATQQLTRTC